MPPHPIVPNLVQEEWDRRREHRILYVAEVEAVCVSWGWGAAAPPPGS